MRWIFDGLRNASFYLCSAIFCCPFTIPWSDDGVGCCFDWSLSIGAWWGERRGWGWEGEAAKNGEAEIGSRVGGVNKDRGARGEVAMTGARGNSWPEICCSTVVVGVVQTGQDSCNASCIYFGDLGTLVGSNRSRSRVAPDELLAEMNFEPRQSHHVQAIKVITMSHNVVININILY